MTGRLLGRDRLRRYAVQMILGLGAGFALGMAVYEARAADDARSLLADPRRLAQVQEGCRTNQPWATDALCREAAQAIRWRFRGRGVPYTPHRSDPFPTKPQPRASKPIGDPATERRAAPSGQPR